MKKLMTALACLMMSLSAFGQTELPVKGEVTVHETDNKGKHFSYILVNEGEETLEGGSYRVYLKVNKKYISFDRVTSDLEPGQAIRYESNEIFMKDEKTEELNYLLELTTKKPKKRHTLAEGLVTWDE
ncbi:hypothetical protein KIH41_02025 [Litoribacter ruber]|uniref:Uncharacterized protein n=1 Tax=Litoribacter ruber TaxID=702568 RepID=A0AAP2CKB8_9BACT|nr:MULTISPECIES: hypothetical protein [Litoribacter]MBS9524145.1 hypothetical protein [Litoribacter alkaliphilus]MBT0810056.1 hypothetical protein [Litoribacter ruber]